MKQQQRVYHTLEPVYDQDSKILLLGTIPSPKSREYGFYYSHPCNRFWKVMGELFSVAVPQTNQQKQDFLLRHHIALWDVLASCGICGADDSSIRQPQPNDVSQILSAASIQQIYTTGKKATDLYRRLIFPQTGRESLYLPSTSPANCRLPWDTLVDRYRIILEQLN